MTRMTLSLVVLLCFLPIARGSMSSPQENNGFGERAQRDVAANRSAAAQADDAAEELMITDRTEIQYNGKACRYEEVPPNSDVQYMEVARDRRTILKLYFQSR